jgi:hypothetical protein
MSQILNSKIDVIGIDIGKNSGQAREEVGALRAQVVHRSSQETTAPQRAGNRARQQARPHRVGGSVCERMR